LERIKSFNELGGLDMGCVEDWWRKWRKLITDSNANVVKRLHGIGLITRFPKFAGGFIKTLPWWRICFQVCHAYNSGRSSPWPPGLLPCNIFQGEEIRMVENNIFSFIVFLNFVDCNYEWK
jgi:hypothetical protein